MCSAMTFFGTLMNAHCYEDLTQRSGGGSGSSGPRAIASSTTERQRSMNAHASSICRLRSAAEVSYFSGS